jgi:hypothetical protein
MAVPPQQATCERNERSVSSRPRDKVLRCTSLRRSLLTRDVLKVLARIRRSI